MKKTYDFQNSSSIKKNVREKVKLSKATQKFMAQNIPFPKQLKNEICTHKL